MVAEVKGIITAATHDYLAQSIGRVEAHGCTALLIELDTPGGMLEPTRDIVKLLLSAPVPVVTYITPAGGRAGSAGMFVTLAAHVAAMTPGSNIGAAHPVSAGGQQIDPELMRKLTNDAAALARAIAAQRSRDVAWAEQAVRESVSATAHEAVRLGIVDLLAGSRSALLTQLDGRAVALHGRSVELHTRGARVDVAELTIQQRARSALAHPTVISVLLMITALGLVVELSTPGIGVAAGLAILSLLLAAVGLNAVPVNLAGLVLIALAAALFVAELYLTSFGLLAGLGLLLLLLGSALLMDRTDPNFFADASVQVSWVVLIPSAVLLALGTLLIARQAQRIRSLPAALGDAEVVGQAGITLTAVDAQGGQVRIGGEIWQARSLNAIPPGSQVQVERRHGLQLDVRGT